jgi:hypothetical protein
LALQRREPWPMPKFAQPVSVMIVCGVMSPSSSAASAAIGLNVEPTGYEAPIARLKRGEPASSPNSAS